MYGDGLCVLRLLPALPAWCALLAQVKNQPILAVADVAGLQTGAVVLLWLASKRPDVQIVVLLPWYSPYPYKNVAQC